MAARTILPALSVGDRLGEVRDEPFDDVMNIPVGGTSSRPAYRGSLSALAVPGVGLPIAGAVSAALA